MKLKPPFKMSDVQASDPLRDFVARGKKAQAEVDAIIKATAAKERKAKRKQKAKRK